MTLSNAGYHSLFSFCLSKFLNHLFYFSSCFGWSRNFQLQRCSSISPDIVLGACLLLHIMLQFFWVGISCQLPIRIWHLLSQVRLGFAHCLTASHQVPVKLGDVRLGFAHCLLASHQMPVKLGQVRFHPLPASFPLVAC